MVAVDLASPMIAKERLACATLELPETKVLVPPKREPFAVSVNSRPESPLLRK